FRSPAPSSTTAFARCATTDGEATPCRGPVSRRATLFLPGLWFSLMVRAHTDDVRHVSPQNAETLCLHLLLDLARPPVTEEAPDSVKHSPFMPSTSTLITF